MFPCICGAWRLKIELVSDDYQKKHPPHDHAHDDWRHDHALLVRGEKRVRAQVVPRDKRAGEVRAGSEKRGVRGLQRLRYASRAEDVSRPARPADADVGKQAARGVGRSDEEERRERRDRAPEGAQRDSFGGPRAPGKAVVASGGRRGQKGGGFVHGDG